MPFIFEAFFQIFIVIPVLIIVEGWHMLTQAITKRNWWWKVPYILLVFLVILLIILLLLGYR